LPLLSRENERLQKPENNWDFAGHKYYYHETTGETTWERPKGPAAAVSAAPIPSPKPADSESVASDSASKFKKCAHCGGWGRGLVTANGHCNHCSRWVKNSFNLPSLRVLCCKCCFCSSHWVLRGHTLQGLGTRPGDG
jgi:hypothetical protein